MSQSKSKKSYRTKRSQDRSGQSNLPLYIVLGGIVLLADQSLLINGLV